MSCDLIKASLNILNQYLRLIYFNQSNPITLTLLVNIFSFDKAKKVKSKIRTFSTVGHLKGSLLTMKTTYSVEFVRFLLLTFSALQIEIIFKIKANLDMGNCIVLVETLSHSLVVIALSISIRNFKEPFFNCVLCFNDTLFSLSFISFLGFLTQT